MTNDFSGLSPPEQRQKLDRTRAVADWTAANGPLGGVILHLRKRARATRRAAGLFLVMLVLAVLTGLLFYLGLPFWQTWADGRQTALEETLAGIDARKAELDADRKALLMGGRLQDGEMAPGLPDLLSGAFVQVPTDTEAFLRGAVSFGDRLFLYGTGGTVLRATSDSAGFETVPTDTTAELDGAVIHGEQLYLFGDNGTVLQAVDDGDRFEEVPTGTVADLRDAGALDDRLFIVGLDGTVLRLTAERARFEVVPVGTEVDLYGVVAQSDELFLFGGNPFDDLGPVLRLTADRERFEVVPTDKEAALNGAVAADDQLILFGSHGTVLRLTADRERFEVVPTDTEADLYRAGMLDDQVFLIGAGGTVLRLTAGEGRFEVVPTDTEAPLAGAGARGGQLFLAGWNGTALRLPAGGTRFEAVPTGTEAYLSNVIGQGDRLFLFGEAGTVLTTADALASASAELPTGLDANSLDAVETFFDQALPSHIQEWAPIRNLRNELRLVASERAGLELIETRTNEDLGRLTTNFLQYLRERNAMDFEAFLRSCRGGAEGSEEITTACLASWQNAQAESQRSWWETLADQLPPGILLLFLLATLGGLYRYNLRLAGFHESRADVLTLLAHGRNETELRDILAGTQGEAVNLATLVMAADKVEMGSIKAKLGQAEIELAKTISGGE